MDKERMENERVGRKMDCRKTGVIALILPSLRIQSLGYYTLELLNAFRQEAAKRGSGVLITALEDAGLLRENMVSGAISFDFLRSIGRSFPNLKNIPLVSLATSRMFTVFMMKSSVSEK